MAKGNMIGEFHNFQNMWYKKALPIVICLQEDYENQNKNIVELIKQNIGRIIVNIYDTDFNQINDLAKEHNYRFLMTVDPMFRILEKRKET